jgi:hypothetical protein
MLRFVAKVSWPKVSWPDEVSWPKVSWPDGNGTLGLVVRV